VTAQYVTLLHVYSAILEPTYRIIHVQVVQIIIQLVKYVMGQDVYNVKQHIIFNQMAIARFAIL
jgi:hypothetical protein